VPAIALSAYAQPQDREAALAAGYDDFVTKPAMPADVLRVVSSLLRRRRRRQTPRKVFAPAADKQRRPSPDL
jgi:CheY-like chemotaxis protein